MPEPGFLPLVHNAALLLAMALVYDLALTRRSVGPSRLPQVPVGLVLGGLGVAVMVSSWPLDRGIVFDTRSILLAVSGLYFGTIPTVVAMAVTAAFRLWMGGAVVTGVSVIVASGGIGLLWRRLRRPRLADPGWAELYALGVTVHLAMLALMLLLPWPTALRVLSRIALPVLLIYPVATAALGLLLANRLRRERSADGLAGGTGVAPGEVADLGSRSDHASPPDASREAERLFRAVFDQAVVAVAQVETTTGRFLRVNQRYADFVGYSREELSTLRFQDVTHPEDVARDLERMEDLRAARVPAFTVDKRYLRKDGTIVWGSLAVSPMWEPGEPPTTNISMVLDITERKRAEEDAWEAHLELRRLLAEADRSRQALLSVVEDQRAAESALRQSEQRYRELSVELERRVQERTAQLQEANRELEAFSYSVSHDLRAPLRAIDGFSRMILEDQGERFDPEARRLLGVVSANARRMAQLIDDLLRLSRLGRSEMQRTTVDMGTLVRAVFEEVVPDPDARARIDFRAGSLPSVEADLALLRQAWVNLLSNAVKFSASRERPVIEVAGEVDGPTAVYSVKDNGAGFDMAYSGNLFGVFQRLHRPSEFEGTGVGLALVKRIVLRHGGRVWAEGAVGHGATFSFSLPVS
ncbi:MAG: LytS/YhcK type 5TM receptor domain-containing protein [Thermoanaerobaculia bacterium]